jgi:hypothetical protein
MRTLTLIRHIRRNVSMAQNANAPTPIRDQLHDHPARDPPVKPVIRARSWLTTLVPPAFVRFLMIFLIGVVATLAWQSYGRAAREAAARWLAPAAVAPAAVAPAAVAPTASTQFAEASSDDLLAMSRNLAALRDGVDKLASAVTKLRLAKQGTPDGASAHPPLPTEAPGQKPVPSPPTPSRAPPMR